jgi:hypothetical protein
MPCAMLAHTYTLALVVLMIPCAAQMYSAAKGRGAYGGGIHAIFYLGLTAKVSA